MYPSRWANTLCCKRTDLFQHRFHWRRVGSTARHQQRNDCPGSGVAIPRGIVRDMDMNLGCMNYFDQGNIDCWDSKVLCRLSADSGGQGSWGEAGQGADYRGSIDYSDNKVPYRLGTD